MDDSDTDSAKDQTFLKGLLQFFTHAHGQPIETRDYAWGFGTAIVIMAIIFVGVLLFN